MHLLIERRSEERQIKCMMWNQSSIIWQWIVCHFRFLFSLKFQHENIQFWAQDKWFISDVNYVMCTHEKLNKTWHNSPLNWLFWKCNSIYICSLRFPAISLVHFALQFFVFHVWTASMAHWRFCYTPLLVIAQINGSYKLC